VQTQYCFDIGGSGSSAVRTRAASACAFSSAWAIASANGAGCAPGPGVHIPNAIVERLERAAEPRAEGKRICIELIRRIREIPGVAGVHVMAPKQDHLVPGIVAESGVLGGREPLFGRAAGVLA
jgi:methylenetetrahydrofolate reductase (NADPH)